MASGERIKQAAQRARNLAEQKRLRLMELRRRIEAMHNELNQLTAAANEWEREMSNMQGDLAEIERLAADFDAFEQATQRSLQKRR